jgi:hypothetical protein
MAQPVSPPPFDPKDITSKMLTNWHDGIRAPASTVPAPKTSATTGIPGQIAYDGAYFYVCVQKNTWLRTPLGSF